MHGMSASTDRLQSTVEWTLLGLLSLPALGGMVYYGGVRFGMSAPFILTVYAASVAVFLQVLRKRGPAQLCLPPGFLPLLLFGIYLVFWCTRAPVPDEAWMATFKMSSYVLAYACVCALCARRGRWRLIVGLVLLVSSLLAWYAIIQNAHESNMVLQLERPESYGMRASATYICPNHFAHVLQVVIVMAAVLVFMPSAQWPLRLLSGYAIVVSLPVLLMTASRSAWIGTAVGLVTAAVLLALRRSLLRSLAVAVAAILIVAATAAALYVGSDVFQTRVDEARKGNMRLEVWQDTVEAVSDKPLTGYGPGMFRWIYPKYKQTYGDPEAFPRYAHNEYLNAAIDYGWIGVGLLALAFGVGLFRFLRTLLQNEAGSFTPVVAGLIGAWAGTAAHAVFDFNLHLFANVHLLFLLSAVVAGQLYAARVFLPRPVPRAAQVVVLGACTIGCMALGFCATRALLSDHYMEEAERLRTKEHDPEAAVEAAAKAVAFWETNWRAHKEQANARMTQSFWHFDREERPKLAQGAREGYEEVLRLNPYEMHAKYQLSQLYGNVLNDQETSLELMREIMAFSPRHAYYQAQLGLRLRRMGRDEEALEAFQTARRLNPGDQMAVLNIRSLKKKLNLP